MEPQAVITRDDLYFPNLGEPREIWTFVSDFTGAVALWAIKQSPYPCPENLETVVRKLDEACKTDFNSDGMRRFESFKEVEAYISGKLRQIPEYMAWNDRKNGDNSPFNFVSRYDAPRDPDNDFIDISALERNAAMYIVQQAALN